MKKSFQNKNDVSSSGYEDSGSEIQEYSEPPSNEQKSDILQSLFAHKNYKGLKEQTNFKLPPEIDSDEEVHLLKIPKGIDPKVLKNAKVSLTKKSKVRTQSEIFYMQPLSDVPQPRFFIGSDGLKMINPVSILQLEKFVADENETEKITEVEENNIKPLPINIIVDRHPIFGGKYEERIKLQEEIQQRLQQALQRAEKKKTSPKRKKKQTVENEEYDDKSLLISQILEAKFNSKKSRNAEKCKKTDSLHTQQFEIDVVHKEKKSKKKNKKDITEHNENSFQAQVVKNEIIIHDDHNLGADSLMSGATGQCSTSGKKKHKNRTNVSGEEKNVILSESVEQESQIDINQVEKTKKKNKHKNLFTAELEIIPSDSTCTQGQEKKKKKQKDEGNIPVRIKEELMSESDNQQSHIDTSITKKKKKKHTEKKCENILVDVKKEIQSEAENLESSFKEKKKKKRRRDSEATFFLSPVIKQELDDSFIPPPKRRKSSILSSTVIKEGSPDFKPDLSAIVQEE